LFSEYASCAPHSRFIGGAQVLTYRGGGKPIGSLPPDTPREEFLGYCKNKQAIVEMVLDLSESSLPSYLP
jgi:hypothetical protein